MTSKTDEMLIRELIENWAAAVRAKDYEHILAHHSDDIVMYDVPPPFQSVGIEAYRKTWDAFFNWENQVKGVFDIQDLHIVCDKHIAFCYSAMQCANRDENGEQKILNFWLTMGLKKVNDQWIIVHEHHSVPAE